MTPSEAQGMYRRQLNDHGETVTVRRYAGVGADRAVSQEQDVIARVVEYRPADLVGGIKQGDRRVILLAEDLEDGDVTLPIVRGDKIVVRGRELAIEAVDDNTRRIAGTLIAYDLQVRG